MAYSEKVNDWQRAVVAALGGDDRTGAGAGMAAAAQPSAPDPPSPNDLPTTADELIGLMAAAGQTADDLRQQATAAWQADRAWPAPLDPAVLRLIGPARWSALVAGLLARLGLVGLTAPPSRRTTLTADERRLLDDLPPHHGLVG